MVVARDPAIAPLLTSDLGGLRWLGSRFTESTLSDHLAVNPGLSWRARSNDQYVVGGYWRRRPEIAGVVELASGEFRRALVDHLVESARPIGCELVVAEGYAGDGNEELWGASGFAPIDEIVEYERISPSAPSASAEGIRRYDPADLEPLMALERRSFPWLWWNSRAEMARYSEAAESEIWVVDSGQALAAYIGLTFRGLHGHLDRLAVDPELRRRGLGARMVAFALGRFAERRLTRVTLTTQHDNERARSLYAHFGFEQTRYRLTIWGKWLGRPRDRTP